MEIWKDIENYIGHYQISNKGRVRSLSRVVLLDSIKYYTKKDRILKPSISGNGYLKVTLSKNTYKKDGYLHILVAESFLEEKNDSHQCINHKDGNKHNNNYENLEWTSFKNNTQHAFKNNLINIAYGERHGFAKLTEKDVNEIRKLKNKYNNKELGEMFSVHQRTIYDIINSITWRHLLWHKKLVLME